MNHAVLRPRDQPYIYASWVAKYLSGEQMCGYSQWVRAHYYLDPKDKVPSDFDRAKWIVNHTALVRRRTEELRGQGWDVFNEEQNNFSIIGSTSRALFAGKPDIVAFRESDGLVEDCKTGAQKVSDVAQLQLYMYLMPLSSAGRRLRACALLEGHLIYKNTAPITIAVGDLTTEFKDQVRHAIAIIAQDEPLQTAPVYENCRWCDVAGSVCPDRIGSRPQDQDTVETDAF
jgi:PD-(D/E)XK nuclease superfamily